MSIKSEVTGTRGNATVELVVDTDEGRTKLKDIPNRGKGKSKAFLKAEGDKELKRNPGKRRGPKPVPPGKVKGRT